MSSNTNNSDAATRRELLEEIGALLGRLRELDLREGDSGTASLPTIRTGSRVEVIVRDKWHGRVGEVIGPHGRTYWNVRLDRVEGETMSHIIHKKGTSLRLLG